MDPNLYGYVNGNPINFSDSYGLMAFPQSAFPSIWSKDPAIPSVYTPLYGGNYDKVIFGRWAGSRSLVEGKNCERLDCIVKCEFRVVIGEYAGRSAQWAATKAAEKLGQKMLVSAIPVIGWFSTGYSVYQGMKCFVECSKN